MTSVTKIRSSNNKESSDKEDEIQSDKKLHHRQSKVFHFGGPFGAVFIMIAVPILILSINQLCNEERCTLFAIPRFPSNFGDYFDMEAVCIFFGWFIFQAILFSLPIGKVVEGQAIPNGKRLRYRLNGYFAFIVSIGLLAFLFAFDYPLHKIHDKWLALHITSLIFSYAFSAFLFLKSYFVPKSHLSTYGNTGNLFYDYFMGRELNPRIGKFDIKVFFELRPGLIGWIAMNIAFLAKDIQQHGYVNSTLLCCCCGQFLYVWDGLYFEEAVLTTMDITTEGLGFMLVYGDLTFVPFVFSMTPRFLLEHHYQLPLQALLPIISLTGLGYYIFRATNSQKHNFLRLPTYAADNEFKTIPAKGGRKLLVDGWWGWVRHPNYFGDILTGLSWCALSVYTDYDRHVKPGSFRGHANSKQLRNKSDGPEEESPESQQELPAPNESMFQDTIFFVVSAFSLAYCFLSRHNFSSLAGGILITAISAQWGMLCKGFVYTTEFPIPIDMMSLLSGVGMACLILVTWGALIGKLSPLQLTVMIILEVPLAVAMEYVTLNIIMAKDVGGSMICHEFGAYFGVGVAVVLHRKEFQEKADEGSTQTGAFRCLVGTMIFWLFWPTAIAAPLVGPPRFLVFINIYMAMIGSCITTFAVSSLLDKKGKFEISHIQNATIAGGVAAGTAADTLIGPGNSLIVGAAGAIVTILGMDYLQPLVTEKLHIHDTAGVHNLHGLVGILGGAVGALAAAIATEETYGPGLYLIFPTMAPEGNSSKFETMQKLIPDLVPGQSRSPGQQAGFQLCALAACCIVPIVGGALTGLILRSSFLEGPTANYLYNDHGYWKIPAATEDDFDKVESFHSISGHVREADLFNNRIAPTH